jgi:hypothetical protein
MLGPYVTRAEALTAETEWLTQNWLRRPSSLTPREPNRPVRVAVV